MIKELKIKKNQIKNYYKNNRKKICKINNNKKNR